MIDFQMTCTGPTGPRNDETQATMVQAAVQAVVQTQPPMAQDVVQTQPSVVQAVMQTQPPMVQTVVQAVMQTQPTMVQTVVQTSGSASPSLMDSGDEQEPQAGQAAFSVLTDTAAPGIPASLSWSSTSGTAIGDTFTGGRSITSATADDRGSVTADSADSAYSDAMVEVRRFAAAFPLLSHTFWCAPPPPPSRRAFDVPGAWSGLVRQSGASQKGKLAMHFGTRPEQGAPTHALRLRMPYACPTPTHALRMPCTIANRVVTDYLEFACQGVGVGVVVLVLMLVWW